MSRLGYKPKDDTGGKLISGLRQEILSLASTVKQIKNENKSLKQRLDKIEKQVGSNLARF